MKPTGIITLFVILWCSGQAYSQAESFTPEWAYGFNGGITSSRVGFNSHVSVPQVSLRQFSGGVAVRYISEKNFGILGELNYSQRGWKERTDTIHLNQYVRSVNYLEIPVMTHLYFEMGKHVRLIFNAGPQIGFYLGEKELERDIVEINDPDYDVSYYDLPIQQSFDYGLKATAGLEFRTIAGSVILDVRYYFGLSDIFNSTKADVFQASNNRILGFNLTYLFK
jgi:hypothetical protein